jgi:16S rRNA (cytosine967-C5)-methyltransferase
VSLNKVWAKGLINAVLRQYQRTQRDLLNDISNNEVACFNAPEWLITHFRQDWPEHWQSLLKENTRQAPMTLRVNTLQSSVLEYQAELTQSGINASALAQHPTALVLDEACDVAQLPGFNSGRVSVQDAAGQWAALLLDVQSGDRVLDACAAPGGKTLHLLQSQPLLDELIALELDETRAARIQQNLQRAVIKHPSVSIKIADSAVLDAWWDGKPFQRILLDVPCSVTGVIRRHPDIQLLRKESDIAALITQQSRLLRAIWQTLASGGELLYCTCSVLKQENEDQIVRFINEQEDAEELPMQVPTAMPCKAGVQILTGSMQQDGFYYAKLRRK